MWKLAPASDAKHIFSEGDKIRVRSGNYVSRELILERASNKKLCWREKGDNGIFYGWSLDSMTRGFMSEMGDFYGRTIDLWVEENNTVNQPAPAAPAEVKPNTLVLVGKQFTKLVDGARFVMKPYDNGLDQREYTVVVSRHNSGRDTECIQVHVQHDGKPQATYSFAYLLDSRTLADIPMFEKHSAYLVKNYQKANTSTVSKPVVEEDDDANGKYIIWCPTSDRAPQKILKGRKQAKKVACEMSERHGTVFYWCRLMGVAKQATKEVVIVKKVTEITTL